MTDIKNLVSGLYDLLEPVDPANRKKAIKAALTMLGDDAADATEKAARVAAPAMMAKMVTNPMVRAIPSSARRSAPGCRATS